MNKVTLSNLRSMKQSGDKFACLTAYDATFAHSVSSAGIEVILVGDSLGMVLQGKDSTVPVTIDEMTYHVEGVARGNQNSLIMADMPFMSYATAEQACDNAAKLMRAGAHLVKLEGEAWLTDAIIQLDRLGVPVCAHLGLLPQSVNKLGGYKVQGRESEAANQMIADAKVLEAAGAAMLLLECVPKQLGKAITDTVNIPVIGIGAGSDTDGQVLVLHDMLGIGPHRPPRFVKNFMAESDSIQDALKNYHTAVTSGTFPSDEHGFD